MNVKPYERAARIFCVKSGLNPDVMVQLEHPVRSRGIVATSLCAPIKVYDQGALAAMQALQSGAALGAMMTGRSRAAWRRRSRYGRAQRGAARGRRPGIDGRSCQRSFMG